MIDYVQLIRQQKPLFIEDDLEECWQNILKSMWSILLEELSPKEAIYLKAYVIEHMTMTHIAKMYKVSQPTVSRSIGNSKNKINNILKYIHYTLVLTANLYK